MTTKKQQVLDHVASHPGATTQQIADATGVKPSTVGVVVFYATHATPPLLHRSVVGRTTTGRDVYGYTCTGVDLAHSIWPTNQKASPLPKAPEQPAAPAQVSAPIIKAPGNLEAAIDALADMLVQRVCERAEQIIAERVSASRAPAPEIRAPLCKEHAAKPRRPRVAVLGLLPQQAGFISNEFGDVFDLRFWKDESTGVLKDRVRHADHVITFTSKIAHAVEHTLKSQGITPERVSGGMTALRNYLTQLYCAAEDANA